MKKTILIGLLLVLGLFSFINKDKIIYHYQTLSFNKISTNQFYELLDTDEDETYFVYFGRSTCPYCQDFVGDLKEAAKKTGTTLYYIDTENTKTDSDLKNLRDLVGVELVPNIVKIDTSTDTLELLDITNRQPEDLMLHFK